MVHVLDHPMTAPRIKPDLLPVSAPKIKGRKRGFAFDLALVGLGILVMAGGAYRVAETAGIGGLFHAEIVAARDAATPAFDDMSPEDLANIATAAGGNN